MRSSRFLATLMVVISFLAAVDGFAQLRASKLGKLEGVVRAAKGQRPLSGATVSWSRVPQRPGETTVQGATDELGRYSFLIPILSRADVDTIQVSIDANAHQPRQATLKVRGDRTTQFDAMLLARPNALIGTIVGRVTNARTGEGVEGAEVTILNAGGVLQAVTDAAGGYEIPGVGFRSDVEMRMVTPSEADTPDPKPCLVPMQVTFPVEEAVVRQDLASVPATTHSPNCITSLTHPGADPGGSIPAAVETLANDASLQWHQADAMSIQIDADQEAWHSGHINSLVQLDGNEGFLVGSDTGGVWAISSNQQALSLSFTWDSININTIAAGPGGGGHFYAGTYGWTDHSAAMPSVLWETDTLSIAPLLNWKHVTPLPPCGGINKILVMPEVNDIVLACDNGIWWSPIPPAPSVQGTYVWKNAVFGSAPPLSFNFSGLAKGPTIAGSTQASIVAIVYGGDTPGQLIYQGHWVGADLVLTGGAVSGAPAHFERGSIASCSANLNVQYAIAAAPDDEHLGGVWRSTDGGATWQPRTVPDVGVQGRYNQDVAVSPADCNIVAVAWRTIGPFLSTDGGGSYTDLNGGGPHQHSDLHAVVFDRDDPNTIFVGSDGGLLIIHDITGTPTFESKFNRDVLDLQMYHAPGSTRQKELVATSLQDNGTDHTLLQPVGFGSWDQLDDSDGAWSEFVTPPSLPQGEDILIRAENVSPWISHLWNGTHFEAGHVIPVSTKLDPRDPDGIARGPVTKVRFPHFLNQAGQLMYAVAGLGDRIFGLFSNDDGSDLHWEPMGMVAATEHVSSFSSFDGTMIFAGTEQGHIYRLEQPYFKGATLMPVNNPTSGTPIVTSIVEFVPTVAFAALNSGYVLGWFGHTWDALGGGTLPSSQAFFGVLLPDLKDLIALSPTSVYISHDLGTTWATANIGLPLIPQGIELRHVIEPDNTQLIYMATYGHSLWRTVFRP